MSGENFVPEPWSQDVIDAVMGNQGGQDVSPQQAATAIQMGPQGGDQQQASVDSVYQALLGRGVDPSGAATYAGWNPADVFADLQRSQEYSGRVAAGLAPPASAQGNQSAAAQQIQDLADTVFNLYRTNQNYDQQLNQLTGLYSTDPAAYFRARIGLSGKQMGWQAGQGTAGNNETYQKELQSFLPGAKAAGVTDKEIQNLVGTNAEEQAKVNAERIASDAKGQKGWINQNIPGGTNTLLAAAAIAAPYLAPELFATMGAVGGGALTGGVLGGTRAALEHENILKGIALGAGTGAALGYGFDAFGNPVDVATADDMFMGQAMQNMPAQNPYNNFDFGSSASPTFDLNSTIAADVFTPQELEAWRLGQQDASAAINTGTQSAGNPSYLTPEAQPYFPDEFPALEDPYAVQDVMQQSRNVDALPNTPEAIDTAAKTTLLEDLQNGSKDALDWVKENPYSAAGILGATTLGAMGLMGKGPLAFLGPLVGTPKDSDKDKPTTPTSSDPKKPGTPGGPGTPGTPKGLPINPKTGKPYGAGELDPNYQLRNRINASNVYSSAAGYTKPFAHGGEVKHFGLGGLSDSLTKVFQPIEKSVIQPIGQAAPFLKDALPYAGMIAAPFIASPIAAAGVGALASGIGKGGFNMKRALMGGISAYGLSNLGGGVEAAGFTNDKAYEAAGITSPTEANNFFRSPSTMADGLQNLARGGDSYKLAAANFATKAGLPSAAMSIMGTAGVDAVNEGITQQNQANEAQSQADSTAATRQARIDRQKQTARDTVSKYPFQFAMGGSIDDEYGVDNMNTQNGNMQNGFMGYAMGGRFLSGGGDGMSDSIHASIEGNQEARLADGEFVIPADVVSHIGNGSSKAGAKQLYNMMDRIRQARTGNKKQGREIKPNKFMPA